MQIDTQPFQARTPDLTGLSPEALREAPHPLQATIEQIYAELRDDRLSVSAFNSSLS
jgi:FXSXX-COOH protein